MTFDLVIRKAGLRDGRTGIDIAVRDGRVAAIEANIAEPGAREIDATGCLATPPFVDCHFHLDSTLSLGRPRYNESGTLLEGIALWAEQKPDLTVEDILERARRLCHWAIARGTLAIRSHVDVSGPTLKGVEALTQLRAEMAPYIDIQLVAFPQDGYLRHPDARANLKRALDMGVDVVGGIPHFERTMADGAAAIRELCEIAAGHGLPVDMHCDESDDPMSRHVEALCAETVRCGLTGRVSASHVTSMHSMDNYYVSKLMPLIAEAGISVIANPLINITLQGRHDTYPKRRGMTRVKELMAAGINTAFGHDCVMDPWYPLGSHDMLEVAMMGLHVGHMTGRNEMPLAFDAVTTNAARAMGLADYGLRVGGPADIVVLAAGDCIEALRLRASRLHVIRNGTEIATSAPATSRLKLADAELTVDFRNAPNAAAAAKG